MTKTVTSLFHDQHKANSAVSRLEQAGISRSDVDVFTGTADDLADKLAQYGVPASDAQSYAEGVRRGGALVTVSCDDDEVDQVVSLLEDDGVLDLGERESLQAEGLQGRDRLGSGTTGLGAAVGAAGAALTGSSGARGTTGDLTGSSEVTRARGDLGTTGEREDEVIPIAEEELHVGKREVSHGRVRIHSHVVERPVQEQVTLRDETVDVERRPASDRSGTLSGDPFQERTIEVEEHDEEAVVSKEARVKEELVVHKDVDQRTETVSDTVRRTEVDVEDERGVRSTGTTGSTDRKR